MSNFEESLAVLLKHEGGYTDDPNDSGGPTNYGLTFDDMIAMGLAPTALQIKFLLPNTAAAIYKKLYWYPMFLDKIENDFVATVLFDQCVLAGMSTVTKIAQNIVGTWADGIMGPLTVGAINKVSSDTFCLFFLKKMEDHYHDICDQNPKDAKFLKGWLARIDDLRNLTSK